MNTNVPFVGNCINFGGGSGEGNTEEVNQLNAFPKLMGALMNIVMTASLIIGFVLILVGGIMIATGGVESGNVSAGKKMILKV